ncbi:MAG: hypothetical protein R2716_04705 [Microthrixaceae bacterium]
MLAPAMSKQLPAELQVPARVLGPALLVLTVQLVFLWVPPTESPQVYLLGLTSGLLVPSWPPGCGSSSRPTT